ncbi:MAG: hypothetical protein R6V58_17925 [Planctomycetota bacterium]
MKGKIDFAVARIRGRGMAWLCVMGVAWLLVFGLAGRAEANGAVYFYMITDHNGTMELRELTVKQAKQAETDAQKEYVQAARKWVARRKKWKEVAGERKFPVPGPTKPTVRRLARAATKGETYKDAREKLERRYEKYKARIEKYNVCVVTDCDGKKVADVIRHDKVRRRYTKLLEDYTDRAMEYIQAKKEDPEVGDDQAPQAPRVAVFKSGLSSIDKAEKLAQLINQKLAARRTAEAEK